MNQGTNVMVWDILCVFIQRECSIFCLQNVSGGEPGSTHHLEPGCPLECHKLDTKDYADLLWTTVAEFPGMFHVRTVL